MIIYPNHFDLIQEIAKLSAIEKYSEYYGYLLSNDIIKTDLDNFINAGCNKKSSKLEYPSREKFNNDLDILLDMGGLIAGGAAVSKIFKTHKVGDFDIYFKNPVDWIKGVLLTYSNPTLDVCFYFNKPYELFDLSVVQCSIGKNSIDITTQCQSTIDTGVCNIIPKNIIDANATARRIIKYNKKLGILFRKEQILWLCSSFKIDDHLIDSIIKLMV